MMPGTPVDRIRSLEDARRARERAEERVRMPDGGNSPADTAPDAHADDALLAARDGEQKALAAVLRDVQEAVMAAGITGRYHAIWDAAEARWRVTPLPDDDSEEPPTSVTPAKA